MTTANEIFDVLQLLDVMRRAGGSALRALYFLGDAWHATSPSGTWHVFFDGLTVCPECHATADWFVVRDGSVRCWRCDEACSQARVAAELAAARVEAPTP